MKIKILHLYPDLLNLYGDRGNIECMRKRLMWRGIDAEVVTYTCEDSGFDLYVGESGRILPNRLWNIGRTENRKLFATDFWNTRTK